MAVRKFRHTWWIDFQFNDTRYRKRSPENTRTGALAYEAMLRHKLARGLPIGKLVDEKQEQTFEEFARQWLVQYVTTNNKPSEQRNRRYIMNSVIIPFFGGKRLKEITARTIEQYKAIKLKEGLSNKTIKNHLTLLNRCLATAYEWLALSGSPPKIRWPKCAPPDMNFLSFDECELLLSAAEGLDYEMILTALRTGMRQGELKGLQWSSINWENRSIAVRHSLDSYTKALLSPKSNRIRHIPMDADVYEVLFWRKKETGYVFSDREGRPFLHNRLNVRLRKVCAKAGLRKIGWHTLRHTFASHLAMRGVPLTAVKELLGHSSITTTMRYSHLAPSTLRSAINLLNPKSLADESFGQPGVNRWRQLQLAQRTEGRVLPKAA
jgi:integrase